MPFRIAAPARRPARRRVALELMEARSLVSDSLLSLVIGVGTPAVLVAAGSDGSGTAKDDGAGRLQVRRRDDGPEASALALDSVRPTGQPSRAMRAAVSSFAASPSRPASPAPVIRPLGSGGEDASSNHSPIAFTQAGPASPVSRQGGGDGGASRGSGPGATPAAGPRAADPVPDPISQDGGAGGAAASAVGGAGTRVALANRDAGVVAATPPSVAAGYGIRPMSLAIEPGTAGAAGGIRTAGSGVGTGTGAGFAAMGTSGSPAADMCCSGSLSLMATGNIVAAPENAKHDDMQSTCWTPTGTTDRLGELPMAWGRSDMAGATYVAPSLVVATMANPTGCTYRWQRTVTGRYWYIRKSADGTTWNVTQQSREGVPAPLYDGPRFGNNYTVTPSPTNKLYLYDTSGDRMTDYTAAQVGDYVRGEKQFAVKLQCTRDGGTTWDDCLTMNIAQVIDAKRVATTGVVANDWVGVDNYNEMGTQDVQIDSLEVYLLVGSGATINIDPSAND